MIFRLLDHPDKAPELRDLVAQHFPKGDALTRPTPVEKEFPLLMGRANFGQIFFSTENGRADGRVVATASYRSFDFVVKGAPLKVAAIGLVVTDPSHRRQGFSERLLKFIEEKSAREGAALTLLWSDLDEFYRRKGYWPSGTELQWDLESLRAPQIQRPEIYEVEVVSVLSQLATLYRKQAWGPQRDFADYAPFASLSDTALFAARFRNSRDWVAYAAVGKGRDLRGIVHEHAGDSEALFFLLQKISERLPLKKLVAPPVRGLEEFFNKKLQNEAMRAGLAYFKIVHTAHLVEFLNRALGKTAAVKLTSATSFQILCRDEVTFESDDLTHLLQIFWGPWRPDEVEGLPESTRSALKDWQAEGFYFWGFDSV